MSGNRKRLIGTMLVEEGMISTDQLNEALARQQRFGGKIVQNLIALEYIDADTFTSFLARLPGVPKLEIGRYGVPQDVIGLISRTVAVQHEIFPLDRIGDNLTVGMICPLDTNAIREVEGICGMQLFPVLCSAPDLRAGIERYYGAAPESAEGADPSETDVNPDAVEASMKLAAIPELIRQLNELPALPVTIRKLRDAVDSPDVSPREVGAIISTDPPLAAKLLQIANSPAYGFPNQIASVPLAVSLLGMQEACSVALTAAVVDLLNGSKHFDYKMFWVRSMLCGNLAKRIARIAGYNDMTGIFTAGVLLDLGRLALAEVAPQRYATLDPELRGPEWIAAEEQLLSIAHPEAGYLLAHAWGLPPALTETIRYHHMPEHAQDHQFTASLCAIAHTMAYLKAEERENPEIVMSQCDSAFANLSLPEELVLAILDEMRRVLKSGFLLHRRWESENRQSQLDGTA